MAERIFVGVAWPYVNGPAHIGQIAGAYLPADVFARYHRLKGNQVIMVSGSDQHGTPITIRAEQEGVTPQELAARYHAQYLEVWEKLGISWDCYTSTGTDNHRRVVHDIFTTLRDRGYISTESRQQPYCETDRRFLPDRYVEGTCPTCSYASARGDQCERCGELRDPQELVDWRCRICGHPPILRESEHFFLRLSAFREMLIPWVKAAEGRWRANVHGFTLNWITEELKDRPITRDIEWGVPVPLPGYDNKRIYVWFEAVIGYLSAAQEWAQRQGRPDAWREFWQDPDCKSYYFMGKDNIAFHTIIWPAMLMGYGAYDADAAQGAYNLPYDVPANEFVTLQGRKISTSQNWVIWVPDFLERHPPDPLRYYFSANMPESADANFSWSEYVRRNNDELVATYGNLVHRVMTLLHRYFEGRVPQPGPLDDDDNALLQRAEETLDNRWPTACRSAAFGRPSGGPWRWRRIPTATWTGKRHGARPRRRRRWLRPPSGRPSAPSPPSRPCWHPSCPSAARRSTPWGAFRGCWRRRGGRRNVRSRDRCWGRRCRSSSRSTREWLRRRRSASSR